MKISILTLFPEMFAGPFSQSIIKRGVDNGFLEISFLDIREFGIGKHKVVDDTPYGGGTGMILRADILLKAIKSISNKKTKEKIVLLSASGFKYTQKKATEYSKLDHLILICGHYEGVDERIRNFIDEEISIGDYVLTGGEIPAMVITDSVSRLVRGVLKEGVTDSESFGQAELLEHPQYTRPVDVEGLKVPEVLTTGNHAKIEEWKKRESLKKTRLNRPDLLQSKGEDLSPDSVEGGATSSKEDSD